MLIKVSEGMQECRSNLQSVECHSIEWRFERLISCDIQVDSSDLRVGCVFLL